MNNDHLGSRPLSERRSDDVQSLTSFQQNQTGHNLYQMFNSQDEPNSMRSETNEPGGKDTPHTYEAMLQELEGEVRSHIRF